MEIVPLAIVRFRGLNTAVGADAIDREEAVLLQNFDASTGKLLVRSGWAKRKSAKVDGTRPVIGDWRVVKVSTLEKKEILHTRNKLWTLSGSAVASITGGYSFTSGHAHTTVTYQDAVYGGNGVDTGWTWTFTGKVSSYSTPSEAMAFVDVLDEKIVFGRGATYKDRFEWTDEGLPTTRQTLSFAFYPPDRTDEMTMMRAFGGEMIFGTRFRIGKTVGGLPPRAVIDIDLGNGCISHYSSAIVAGWLYWVGQKGHVFRTDGNVVQDVSVRKIDTSDITLTNARMLRGWASDQRYYYLSYPSKASGATFPNRILVYDTLTDEWYGPHVGMRASAAFEWKTPGDDGRVTGGTVSGFAATLFSGNSDGGAVITAIYKGPIFGHPDPSYRKAFDEIEFTGTTVTSGTATVGIGVDRKSASSVASVTLKATGAVEGDRDATSASRSFVYAPKKVTFNLTCREYQPRIKVQAKGQPTIASLTIRTRPLRDH